MITETATIMSPAVASERVCWCRATGEVYPDRPGSVVLHSMTHCETLMFLPHLREWRRAAGMSQFDLCTASGVAESTIRRYEHGAPCRLGILSRLADEIGVANRAVIDAPPDEDYLVIPTVRVQMFEENGALNVVLHRLKWQRRNAEVSREALAEGCGVTPEVVRQWEEVEAAAPISMLSRLSALLDVPQLELLRY
jgi:transcriptional regulator with XRE-family HTH domain